jgi:hypothetical protein
MVRQVMERGRVGGHLIGGSTIAAGVLALVVCAAVVCGAGPDRAKLMEQTKAELESLDPFMGDWQGNWRSNDGTDSGALVAQVIALGKGRYQAKFLPEFDSRSEAIALLEGEVKDAAVGLSGQAKYEGAELEVQAVIEKTRFTGTYKGRDSEGAELAGTFQMEKVIRLSPTLRAKPPGGAVVLFNGKNFDEWKCSGKEGAVQWKLVRQTTGGQVDGAMEVKPGTGSIITKKEFADIKLHVEFRTPFMPEARGQGRGNSGVYLQGRYEVQVLDSYGLEGRSNECGGIYGAAQPLVNMCAPPMQWQTFDITFRAARFDQSGKSIEDAWMTVVHNGVKIHEKVKVSKATTAAPGSGAAQQGGIYLQDHGNRVQYRNIWLVRLPEEPGSD